VSLHGLPLWAMTVAILAIAAALVAALSAATRVLHRRLPDDALRIDASMLGVLGVLTALLVTFLANNVWNDNTDAGEAVRQEVRELAQAVRVADHLPELGAPLRDLVRRYARDVIDREWAAMADDEVDPTAGDLLSQVQGLALSMQPQSDNQRELHGRLLQHVGGAIDARLRRLEISQRRIAGLRWVGVLAAAVITMIAIAIVHVRVLRQQLIALSLYAGSIGVILLQILAYDRPFVGVVLVGPEPFATLLGQ
jgi:hypothetical protein